MQGVTLKRLKNIKKLFYQNQRIRMKKNRIKRIKEKRSQEGPEKMNVNNGTSEHMRRLMHYRPD